MKGKIKKLTDKGFGFITPDDGKKDVFFHHSALMKGEFNSLQEGDKVEFDIEQGEKGPKAVNLKTI